MKRTPLKRGKRLRTRPFRERDPEKYGALWEAAKLLPCFGIKHVPRHRCSGRHTAHHDPACSQGGRDALGMLACCELLHEALDNRGTRETRSEMLARAGLTEDRIEEIARATVEAARAALKHEREGLAF